MRNLNLLEIYRDNEWAMRAHGWTGDETCGCFKVKSKSTGSMLRIIASAGMGWDHVSVSCSNRVPYWDEMEQVKRLFFKDDECAMQLHVPPSDHINVHPYCLHLWAPIDGRQIPLPPSMMVGTQETAA